MTAARILVADDEPSIRWLLDRLLRQVGHSVTVAEDGGAALARAAAEPFDLAFVDVRMPDLDGLEVLSRLKTASPDTAVIVMTAHGSVRSAVEAMQRGAYDYLTKPFDNDEVRLLAERALSARRRNLHHAYLRPAATCSRTKWVPRVSALSASASATWKTP